MAYYALVHQAAPQVLLLGVERARFRAIVEPGTEVTFEMEMGEQRFGMSIGRGWVRVDGRTVAEATLKGFAGVPGQGLGG